MVAHTNLKVVVLIAAISSAIQGIAWSVLSLMAVFCYACILKPGPYKHGNVVQVTYLHYLAAYFQGACDENLDFYKQMNQISSPEKVLVIDIFVYIANFTLAIASIIVMFALRSKRKRIFLGWLIFYIITSICVALVDLIATAVAASDYFTVSNSTLFKNSGLAGLSLLVVILITTRGVFLWAANLIFSIYLVRAICVSHKFQSHHDNQHNHQHSAEVKSDPNGYIDSNKTSDKPIFFSTESKAMEDTPIVLLNPSNGYFGKTENEYPTYSAQTRWPRLNQVNKINDRPTTLPNPSNQERLKRQQLHQQLQQHLRQQQQQQQQQQQFNRIVASNRPAPPPIPSTPKPLHQPMRRLQVNDNQQPSNNNNNNNNNVRTLSTFTGQEQPELRPGSLQEAILTVRPLRQVRPRITSIPDKYP